MKYEVSGMGVDTGLTVINKVAYGLAIISIAGGIGVILIPALVIFFKLRPGKIIIDTDTDSVVGRAWSVKLSEVEDIHGEEIWTHSAKNGSSRVNYITLVGGFGSQRVCFTSKDKQHEFVNRLKKAQGEIASK